ncbi:MAG: barstar family protein [Elusimicrobiota bacterium]
MSDLGWLDVPSEPRRADAAEAARLRAAAEGRGWRCVRIQGSAARDKDSLLEAFAKVVPLPDYFGRNWDALEECLREPDILGKGPGCLIEVSDFPLVERGLGAEAPAFLSLMTDLSAQWSRETPPFAFKVLLVNEL